MATPEVGTSPDPITTLGAALKANFGLLPCSDLTALLALYTAGFLLRPPRLTAAAHYDLDPAILIYDPVLGTVGMVEEFPADLPPPSLRTELTRKIDRAANLRQLFLLQAEEASPPVLNLTVELVLLLPNTARTESKDSVGEALQEIARETTYLRAIGVNVLPYSPDTGFERGALRRAFAWLLRDTTEWFRFLAQKRAGGPPSLLSTGTAWSVTLKHYRLAGTRIFPFQENCTLHLLHGHNGSGKSTFSEAVELLLTGAIERLDEAGEKDYFRVVRYRSSFPDSSAGSGVSPAQVILEAGPAKLHLLAVTQEGHASGLMQPGAGKSVPVVTSFRLDQRFMDKLIRSTDSERAGLFLRAFFPHDSYLFTNLVLLQRAAAKALARLPKRFTDAAPTERDKQAEYVVQRLAWTQPSIPNQPVAWQPSNLDILDTSLPLPAAKIRILARVSPRLRSLLESWETDPTGASDIRGNLRQLDECFAAILTSLPATINTLETVARVLDDFKDWRASKQVDRGENFEQSLNEWLELEALSDLVGKYYDVIATLKNAQAHNWHLRAEYAGLLPNSQPTDQDSQRLREGRDALTRARLDAKSKVHAWTGPSAEAQAAGQEPGSADATGGAKPREALTMDEVAALNAADPWLPSVQLPASLPKFGDMFREAVDANEPRTANKTHIGSPGGLKNASDEAAELLAACKDLQAAQPGPSASMEMLRQAEEAWHAANDLMQAQQAVTVAFSKEVVGPGPDQGKLNAALNELLALFNAAPWAYPDIALDARIDQSNQTLGLQTTGGARAELRFNTAELNSLTLALFLLCAPGVENPLRLLILDDPLQNMDEMTVTAIARGLAQLIRIYPPGWQIAALFHGEENTARIRQEAECAVYHLPWLSPAAMETEERKIDHKKELSTNGRKLQKLDANFLTVAPR